MDSLQDLLGKYSPKEPKEIQLIKQYIDTQFGAPANVALRGNTIVITIQSAALANALRFHITKLKEVCGTQKRIMLRIGQVDTRTAQ